MRRVLLLSLLAACSMSARSPRLGLAPARLAVAGPPDQGGTEAYHDWGHNPWVDAGRDHLSTFAADVDTASYTIARRKLTEGTLPPPASVRVEEWVNYFHYGFPPPGGPGPFSVVMDAAPHPFESGRYVLRVGVATPAKAPGEREPASLVFLVDVSGSMASPDKLDLAKRALHVLVRHLTPEDQVAIVTYAGSTRLVLPMTRADHSDVILRAIDSLDAGGSTAMGSGIDLAYDQAIRTVRPGTISRVIVCTDGDANVGAHSYQELLALIAERAKHGVTLSTIGFGMGNYKDTLMEQLADKGNGNNYYIDSPAMAERVFGEQLTSTLEVAAKDVKLQVDFDPARVARYRLIGYEDRDVADRDFRKDDVPAGQVGWGHQVTALYEVELASGSGASRAAPLGLVRIRYKPEGEDQAVEAAFPMTAPPAAHLADASPDLRFAFAVAAFADVMRGAATWSLADIRALAAGATGADPDRRELLALIGRAQALRPAAKVAARPAAEVAR